MCNCLFAYESRISQGYLKRQCIGLCKLDEEMQTRSTISSQPRQFHFIPTPRFFSFLSSSLPANIEMGKMFQNVYKTFPRFSVSQLNGAI